MGILIKRKKKKTCIVSNSGTLKETKSSSYNEQPKLSDFIIGSTNEEFTKLFSPPDQGEPPLMNVGSNERSTKVVAKKKLNFSSISENNTNQDANITTLSNSKNTTNQKQLTASVSNNDKNQIIQAPKSVPKTNPSKAVGKIDKIQIIQAPKSVPKT